MHRQAATRRSERQVLSMVLLGLLLAGCAAAPSTNGRRPVAKVEHLNGTVDRITLTDRAVQRIGIQTTPVLAVSEGTLVPYSALIYDTSGRALVYTSPESLVYLRNNVRVKSLQGDHVILADGPPAGAAVVSVGASVLLGIDLGIGG